MTSKCITTIIYNIDHTATKLEDLTRLLAAVTRDISRYTGGLTTEQIVAQTAANDVRFEKEREE